jgi:hypothetical protein
MDAWVSQHPDSFVVALAASGNESAVQLGNIVIDSFADLLRLGQGMGQGGWGYAQDGLRLLTLAGPLVKGGATLARMSQVRRVVSDPCLDNCAWIAATQALRMSGVRHFAKLDDLIKAAGYSDILQTTGGLERMSQIVPILIKLGAKVKHIEKIRRGGLADYKSLDDIANTLKKEPDGTILFALQWKYAGGNETVGHALVAMVHPTRGLQLADRSGRIVKSLAELEDLYPGISKAEIADALIYIENSRIVKDVGNIGLASMLVLELKAMMVKPPEEAPTPPQIQPPGTIYIDRTGHRNRI